MADTTKDTIYVDVDDEITTVIDKVRDSSNKLVALVLPKRSSVFQSVVNMKLLKRKADEAGKNIVLITTESSLLPLAGSVGFYVAKTLASKPEIPDAPKLADSLIEASEDDAISLGDEEPKPPATEPDLQSLADKPVGELAEKKQPPKSQLDKDLETIELDNAADKADNLKQDSSKAADATQAASAKAAKKAKKDKKLKIPNFERFRLILIIVAIVIVLIGLLWLFIKVLPKATIDIQTDAANLNTSVNFTLSTSTKSLNSSTNTLPAKQVATTKTYTATVNSTGQQNNGQKASGSITLVNCNNSSVTVPAGTGVTSTNNLTYITQGAITMAPGNFDDHGDCKTSGFQASTGTGNITAQSGGSNYNTSNSSFTISGYSGVSGSGSASGGTDDIIQTVTQSDITNAENKIDINNSAEKQSLISQLDQDNYYPINATFNAGSPSYSPSASAGTVANSVTVTATVNYSMYGVIHSNLNTILNKAIIAQVSSNQSILDNGLSNAVYSYTTSSSNPTKLTMQTTAEVGPNINVQTIKAQAAGKKSSEIQSVVNQDPHVTSVTVHMSPFYVSAAPSNTSKISVKIAKPTNNASN